MDEKSQKQINAQKVLITGASLGIGYELARQFARDGAELALVARSGDRLREIASEFSGEFKSTVQVLEYDLSMPGSAGGLFAELKEKGWEADILVNNAGFGHYGFFHETELQREQDMLALNIVTLTELTKFCLGPMRRKGHGRIMNVASTAAFQPGPLMAAYFASKAYVLSFSEAIANELEGSGITVTALCPGATHSGFQSASKVEGMRLLKFNVMQARDVARIGYAGLMKGKAVVIPGLLNKLVVFMVRLGPRCLVRRVVRFLQTK